MTENHDRNIDYFGRIEPVLNFDGLTEKIEQQNRAEEIQQEININKTIHLAEEELLRSKEECPEEDVDPDWMFRWRENSKNTKSEEIRQIWARTLAGEVKSPGSYSLRTLEFIKNLSQNEAIAISKLGKFVIGQSVFKTPRLAEDGIDFRFLLMMDDLGILNGVQGGDVSGLQLTMRSMETAKYNNSLVNRNLILIIESDDEKKELNLDCYNISKIGTEVLSLGDFSADEPYMKSLGDKIKSKGFDVKLALWVPTGKGYGNYFNAQSL